jgi:hypothetical protein
MQKGQWSSTAAMAHYLHDDDEGKQDAQIETHQAPRAASQRSEGKVNICQNENARFVRMKRY